MQAGEIDNAITRLESSVDLDDNVYESRYNLAVAYMQKKECKKALENIVVAEKLIKDEPAVYYTYGVASHCVAKETIEPKDKFGNKINIDHYGNNELYDLNQRYIFHLNNALKYLDLYTKIATNADDTKEVISLVHNIREELVKAESKFPKVGK